MKQTQDENLNLDQMIWAIMEKKKIWPRTSNTDDLSHPSASDTADKAAGFQITANVKPISSSMRRSERIS